MAKKLGCKLEEVNPMSVTGGGGRKLVAPYVCKKFQRSLKQNKFTTDVIVLPLICYYLILGI